MFINVFINNLEEDFFVKGKENSILDSENNRIQIQVNEEKDDTEVQLIKKEEKEINSKMKLKNWIFAIISISFIFIYDALCTNIKSLSMLISPLYEEYSFPVNTMQENYVLEYHRGTFDITGRYFYPYLSGNIKGIRADFSINFYAIRKDFFFAKFYYSFLGIPVAFVCGIGINIIWSGNFFLYIIIGYILWMVCMCIYLERRKRKLIYQLKRELEMKAP